MKRNLGQTDRALRLVAAAVIAIKYFNGSITGPWTATLLLLAAVFVVTAILGFCPLYLPFKIDTSEAEKK
jgi:hypothetical protein